MPSVSISCGLRNEEVKTAARSFVAFLNKAVTPYHAVDECKKLLLAAGFQELKEKDHWKIEASKKYFVTKNLTALCAFAVGGKYKYGNGCSIIAGHTDSPSLRVKPISKHTSCKFLQVGVATYGGGIWRTWFDRDLSIAGKVIMKKDNRLVHTLVNINKPVLFIPNLAIHFSRGPKPSAENSGGDCNTETELRPILSSLAAENLNGDQCSIPMESSTTRSTYSDPTSIMEDHHPVLIKLIADAVGCKPEAIVDLDLYLYDHQPAIIGGVHEEFINGQRLDNLVGTYTIIDGLIESLKPSGSLANDENIRVALCFDNEETGSKSAQGAESHFTEWVLRRIMSNTTLPTAFEEGIGKSFLISADQAHAQHPNYASKHEEGHCPSLHGGIVVKINVNQRYATTSTTHAVLKEIAKLAKVPLQKYVVRNDSPCGSTVGPALSYHLGLQTIDVGGPQLAMHSIRELACTSSISQAVKLYSVFYQNLPSVLASLD